MDGSTAFNRRNIFNDPSNSHPLADTGYSPLKRKPALIILNVQNDSLFIVKNHDFILHLRELIPHFSTIIWTCKHLDSSKDNKFYREGTEGAEISDKLSDLVDRERHLIVISSGPSAFCHPHLLEVLRMHMITDLYLCGCLTNVDVYSTAADAASSGFRLNAIEDCLGYRCKYKHDEAVSQMRKMMEVKTIDSKEFKKEDGWLELAFKGLGLDVDTHRNCEDE